MTETERLATVIRQHATDLDTHRLCLMPEALTLVVNSIWHRIQSVAFNAYGGGHDASPIVGGLTYLSGMTPSYGRFRGFLATKTGVRGPVRQDDKCVLVEDTVFDGLATLDRIKAIEDFGAKVVKVISVVDQKVTEGSLSEYNYEWLVTTEDIG